MLSALITPGYFPLDYNPAKSSILTEIKMALVEWPNYNMQIPEVAENLKKSRLYSN